jgi:hypothetical protein
MPENERASVFEASQIGKETTPGTAVPALKRLLCTMFDIKPVVPVTPYRPFGSLASTTAIRRKEHTEGSIEGVLCYNDIVYLASSNICEPVISTPGGATNAREWLFVPQNWRPNNAVTFTIEQGSYAGAARAVNCRVNSFGFTISEAEANVTGAVIGQTLAETAVYMSTSEVQVVDLGGATGGTFTLTFNAVATAALAFNASAATVETALEGLSTIGAGNATVALDGADYVVTFINELGQTNVATLVLGAGSLTGATSPGVSTTTAGAAPTDIAENPVSPKDVSVYVSDDNSSYTQLDRCLEFEFGLSDRYGMLKTLDAREDSWSAAPDKAPGFTGRLVVALDSQGLEFMDNLRGADTRYLKIVCEDPDNEIETGQTFMIELIVPFKFIENDRGDRDDVRAATFEFEPMYNSTLGGFMQLTVRNALTAL